MRFTIVGIGQTFNLATKEMDDVLQVEAPDGSILSVPTTNEAAQALIRMAMNGQAPAQQVQPTEGVQAWESSQVAVQSLPNPEQVQSAPVGDFPEGADVFGGDASVDLNPAAAMARGDVQREQESWHGVEEEPTGLGEGPIDAADLASDPISVQEDHVQQQIFQKTQRTQGKASNPLGLRRNNADRSGVPSYGIARVDEMGNPILPAAPDMTMGEEEDPGEQV
jgi:hypothetical protein